MNVNYLAVVLATTAQFAVGAIWYMPLFGELWGKIHGFDKFSKEEQKEMQAKMGPYYAAQIFVTFLTALVLAKLLVVLPDYSPYALGLMCWVGFLLPANVSSVIFGGTEPKWMAKKMAVMAGGSLICTVVAVAVLSLVK